MKHKLLELVIILSFKWIYILKKKSNVEAKQEVHILQHKNFR